MITESSTCKFLCYSCLTELFGRWNEISPVHVDIKVMQVLILFDTEMHPVLRYVLAECKVAMTSILIFKYLA